VIGKLLTPRWILTTLLVTLAVGVMIRLGFWQLERLEWRRNLNQQILTQLTAPVLDLNQNLPVNELPEMEYRMVQVRGEFDDQHEFLWRNQVWENQPGYHLFTPLKIENSPYVVYVNRGWIPLDRADAQSRLQYRVTGKVVLKGMIRRPVIKPAIGGVADPPAASGQPPAEAWNWVDLQRWQAETGLNLLPVWVQQSPDGANGNLPYASLPEIEISEGPHFGYALQWFAFAAILAVGYPFFIRKQLQDSFKTDHDGENSSHAHSGEGIYEH